VLHGLFSDSSSAASSESSLSSELSAFARSESGSLSHSLSSALSAASVNPVAILKVEAAKSELKAVDAKKEAASKATIKGAQAVADKKNQLIESKKKIDANFDETKKLSKQLNEAKLEVIKGDAKVQELKGQQHAAEIDLARGQSDRQNKQLIATQVEADMRDVEARIDQLKAALKAAQHSGDDKRAKADTEALKEEERRLDVAKSAAIQAKKDAAALDSVVKQAETRVAEAKKHVQTQQQLDNQKHTSVKRLSSELHLKMEQVKRYQAEAEKARIEVAKAESKMETKKAQVAALTRQAMEKISKVAESSQQLRASARSHSSGSSSFGSESAAASSVGLFSAHHTGSGHSASLNDQHGSTARILTQLIRGHGRQ